MKFSFKIFWLLTLLLSIILSAQVSQEDLIHGQFTYLLRGRPYKFDKKNVVSEPFILQISKDESYFISANEVEFDSIFKAKFNANKEIDMRSFPANRPLSKFIITQNLQNTKYFENIGSSTFFYEIGNDFRWVLVDEHMTINNFNCKKAELNHKGRVWTAWYTEELPFPNGPHIFGGLPGLIIKMYDKTGDFDFELIKSLPTKDLHGRKLIVNLSRLNKAKKVTKKELKEAKENFVINFRKSMEGTGTTFSQQDNENLQERRLRIEKSLKEVNTIEIE